MIRHPWELDFSQLLCLYDKSSEMEQRMFADEFYSYVLSFLTDQHGTYAVWVDDKKYCSALRIEDYRDGVLIAGLHTGLKMRNQGYATKLMSTVIGILTGSGVTSIYSHVDKRNIASCTVHEKCKFMRISDSAVFLDGTVSWDAWTYCYRT